MALYLPFLSTDRLSNGRRHGVCAEDDAPVATIALHGGVLRLGHVDRAAYALRVRRGQTLADAKAIAPRLVTFNDDPAADRRQLEALAVWADRFSPIVHIEAADTLFLDVTGCAHLFGGEEGLLRCAMEELGEQSFAVRAAIADTPGAAWAMAHAHPEPLSISPPTRVASDLAGLAIWSLRVERATVDALGRVGVNTIGTLLHLPRSSLASRFGEGLLERIDQALGDVAEVLTPYRPAPVLKASIRFGSPTDRLDVLMEGLRRTLDQFCETLSRQVAGVCQVFVTLYCAGDDARPDAGDMDHPVESRDRTRAVTLPVSLSQPTRSARHLFSLLRVGIETLSLACPAESLVLWAKETEPLDDWQDELFNTEESDDRVLNDLVDRLSMRLGVRAVVKPEPVSDHQPERAFRYVSITEHSSRYEHGGAALDHAVRLQTQRSLRAADRNSMRPLRLSAKPREVLATAVVPEGPPLSFRFQGTTYAVQESVGPERIETGWWRGPHVRRDYYRVTTGQGAHAWLFRERDTDRWFLQGWFD